MGARTCTRVVPTDPLVPSPRPLTGTHTRDWGRAVGLGEVGTRLDHGLWPVDHRREPAYSCHDSPTSLCLAPRVDPSFTPPSTHTPRLPSPSLSPSYPHPFSHTGAVARPVIVPGTGGTLVDAEVIAVALAQHPDGPSFGRAVREVEGLGAVPSRPRWHCTVRVVACGGLGSTIPAGTPHYALPFGTAKVR